MALKVKALFFFPQQILGEVALDLKTDDVDIGKRQLTNIPLTCTAATYNLNGFQVLITGNLTSLKIF